MNITAFLNYLKTRGWAIDADYYGYIETWRQWWQGSVPKVHTRAAEYANGTKKRPIASLRMPKRVCEDWANLLLNDRTTFQIKDAATARYLLGDDEHLGDLALGDGEVDGSSGSGPTGPAPVPSY